MRPENRTFIISGGCSGLGLATARDLHSSGAYVSLLDLNADAGEQIVKELGKDRAIFFETDVSDTESIKNAVDGTAKWVQQTGKEIGGVVAAAGVGSAAKVWTSSRMFNKTPREVWLLTLSLLDHRWPHRRPNINCCNRLRNQHQSPRHSRSNPTNSPSHYNRYTYRTRKGTWRAYPRLVICCV